MKLKKKQIIAAMALLCVVPLSSFGSVFVDFNNTNDLAAYFNNNDAVTSPNDPDGGLSDSGSVDYNNSGQVFAYNQSSYDLSQGALTVSMYLQIQGNGLGTTENFWLGFTNDNTDDYVNAAGGTRGASEFYLYVQEADAADQYTLNLKEENQRPASSSAATLVDGNWYFLTLTATYVDDTHIDLSAGMYNSAADGTVGSAVYTISALNNANAGASDTTLYGFFGGVTMQNNGSSAGDNFSITQIPEPATLGLIGFAGMGIVFARRFLSM
ncbi:PEP-CTERM sorting domain-containing protein [Pontiella sulfatireligans]|uniref:Ice-binding protein C-terminal domain-containing protein n=1 Tax=Pontiella sulfatireligans TaxID=2750658 RepID=A0A6C2UEN1_9BACT|nr:PEP-CTERM sorting domain-containing protein [Pontiella sulfatireligans]VGO18615.1 hypothetical protein SCARR_00668 [Pontiella sulfatireligans]